MTILTKTIFFTIASICLCFVPVDAKASDKSEANTSTKKERNFISKGNKLYEEGKYKDASAMYQKALNENSNSVVGIYNLGLS